MADGLKQRLIGALLILLFIVIAASFLIKNANDNVEDQSELVLPDIESTIETVDENVILGDQEALLDPHKLGSDVAAVVKDPVVEKPLEIEAVVARPKQTELQKIPEKVQSVETAEVIKMPPPIAKVIEPIKKPVQDSKAKVVKRSQNQWLIQLASFGVKENAIALQKKIKTLGYQSTIQALENSQGKTIYRVKVGPESDKKTVDDIVSKVKQHLKLNPQVIKL